jgi:pimeloyl-ACP methyl ester carboxylesterase
MKLLKDKDGIDIKGSILEKTFIEIGGIQQGFFLRAENPENPVILSLHGGPGDPEFPMITYFESSIRLERYFTIVYWEQRGAGMSLCRSIDPATMNIEQMVEDTRQMTEYLKQRFNQEKIFLMGQSWGSLLGIKTVEKYPENYLAFIGIGQVSNFLESEKLAFNFMLQHALEINDKSAIRTLKKVDINSPDFPQYAWFITRTKLMNKYGFGFMREMPSTFNMIKSLLFFKHYTISEKINWLRSQSFSSKLAQTFYKVNFFESSTTFKVPIYIIHGKYDYITSYALAREYFEVIEAPQKGFFTFENSAHAPHWEEREKFIQIVRNIALEVKENSE